MKSKAIIDVLNCGAWGTIGPHSLSGARAFADFCGAGYCLLTHSASSAYETLLRYFELSHGNLIVTTSFSEPMLSLIPVCMGAAPVFCDIDQNSVLISSTNLSKTIENSDISNIKLVVVDFAGGICPDLTVISQICKKNNLPLILNAKDSAGMYYENKPLTKYADAVICDLGVSSAFNIGNGGAILTDNAVIFEGAFAYHHCGNNINTESPFSLKDILGGDFRITEFQACLVRETISEAAEIIKNRVKKAETVIQNLSCNCLIPVNIKRMSSHNSLFFNYINEENNGINIDDYVKNMFLNGIKLHKVIAMHHQPIFYGEYYTKMTGYSSCLFSHNPINSSFAEANYLRFYL